MASKSVNLELRTLRVRDNKGAFEVKIPADWKVTYGAFNQGTRYPDGTAALRIYEAENKQRACFTGVISFFDTSLEIKREVVTESGEMKWVNGTDGYEKSEKVKLQKAQVSF